MPPGRKVGSKDKKPRKKRRSLTPEEKAERKKKISETKARKGREASQAFFSGHQSRVTVTPPSILNEATDEEVNGLQSQEEESENPEGEYAPLVATLDMPPVTAELDGIDDYNGENISQATENEEEETGDNLDGVERPGGVMLNYLRAIRARLQLETSSNFTALNARWLLKILDGNDWRIPVTSAKNICEKLNLQFDEPSYYREVVVWLPDFRWGAEAMPFCPSCKTNHRVGRHGYQTNHFARRIISLNTCYFAMTAQYICHACKERRTTSQDVPQYTFMGYNKSSTELLPHGYGDEFPAFLSHRAGVDKESVLDLMRPSHDKGLRPEALSSLLLEFHSKKYCRQYLKRENEYARDKRAIAVDKGMYSSFADKSGYDGLVPTGKYLANVHKEYHKTIRPHLDKEVKKRGAKQLSIDASFKEAKHLCQYHGNPIFKGLMTYTNEFGEIRMQHHIVSDSHDQMRNAIAGFLKTSEAYGQKPVELAFTDKPGADKAFLLEAIPSLRQYEAKYNESTAPDNDQSDFPNCMVDCQNIRVLYTDQEIDTAFDALRETLKQRPEDERVVGIDCEWPTVKNSRGMVVKSCKTGTTQVAYRSDDSSIKCLIISWGARENISPRLKAFLTDPGIIFVGVGVSGDLRKLGRDFNCKELLNRMPNVKSLGTYARQRDIVQNGTVGLDVLVKMTLRETLEKPVHVRLSDWSIKPLTEEQVLYAALDAIASLRVYLKLKVMPDLTQRLSADEAEINTMVDIVPKRGNVSCMATRAGWGAIMDDTVVVKSPPNCKPKTMMSKHPAKIVRVDKLNAPHLLVPGLQKDDTGEPVSLGDFGAPPFTVLLPLSMLRPHVDSADIRDCPTDTDSRGSNDETDRVTQPTPSSTAQIPDEANDGSQETDDDLQPDDEEEDNTEDSERTDVNSDDDDDSNSGLTTADIEYLRECAALARDAEAGKATLPHPYLDNAPEPHEIKDRYSSVNGDGFHAIDRPKIPVRHAFKKAMKVALREAEYAWNPEKLEELKTAMRGDGFDDNEIELEMYYRVKPFRDCVDRRKLPPRQLYWRVRAVYVLLGSKVDSQTGQPLFNKRAWKKANGVLKDILAGYLSDPPGVPFYTFRMNSAGEPMKNKYGLHLLNCNRGTSDVESIHKHLVTTFGTWCTGVEMSDCLLSERRHRHNHRSSERRRHGFPRIGHFDTWLIDRLQLIVEHNHGVLLYPGWTNSSDYKSTPESFDTIPLQNLELHQAVEAIQLKVSDRRENAVQSKHATVRLTREQAYIANAMNSRLPYLPVYGLDEMKLFSKLILEFPFDAHQFSLEWVKHCNGTTIFPKLIVHLAMYYERWKRNQAAKDAVGAAKSVIDALATLNNNLCPPSTAVDLPRNNRDSSQTAIHWPAPIAPRALEAPLPIACHTHEVTVVGGTRISIDTALLNNNTEQTTKNRTRRRKGERSTDLQKRRKRRCMRCVQFKAEEKALNCRGRHANMGRAKCENFDADGNQLT